MAAPPFGLQDGARLWAVAVQASEDFNRTVASELYQAQLASVLEVLFRCSELSESATDSTPGPRHQALHRDLTQLLEDLLQWAKAPGADDSSGGSNSGNGGGDSVSGGAAKSLTSAVGTCLSPQRDAPALLALAAFNRRVVALQRTCCALAQTPDASLSRSSSGNLRSALGSGRASPRSAIDPEAPANPRLVAKRMRRVSWGDAVVDRGSPPTSLRLPPTFLARPASPTSPTDHSPTAAAAGGGNITRHLPPRPLQGHPSATQRPSIELGGAPLPFLPRRANAPVSCLVTFPFVVRSFN